VARPRLASLNPNVDPADPSYKFFLFRKIHSNVPYLDIAYAGTGRDPGVDIRSSIYSEIKFAPFAQVLQEVCEQFRPGATFCDLGSGAGKACVAAHLVFPFSKIVGVEREPRLLAAAEAVLEQMHTLKLMRKSPTGRPCGIIQYEARELTRWFEDSKSLLDGFDVVFAHSTAWDTKLTACFARAAKRLRPGACVLTVAPLAQTGVDSFDLLRTHHLWFTHGQETLHVYRRKAVQQRFRNILKPLCYTDIGEEEQEKVLRGVFESIDEDKSGLLDMPELHGALTSLGMGEMTDEELSLLMEEIDEDNDGTLDFDEFRLWYKKAAEVVGEGDAKGPSILELFAGADPTVTRHNAAHSVYYSEWEFLQPKGWAPDDTHYAKGTLAYEVTERGMVFYRITRNLSDRDLECCGGLLEDALEDGEGAMVAIDPARLTFVGDTVRHVGPGNANGHTR